MKFHLQAAVSMLLLAGCTYFVSRREANDMAMRVERIAQAYENRAANEATLRQNLAKVKTELEKIREERALYREKQSQFMDEIRERMDDLRKRVLELEQRVHEASGRIDDTLARQITQLTDALAQRVREIAELETFAREVAWVSTQLGPEDLRDMVLALALAKQWKLAHGHLALLLQKHPGTTAANDAIAGMAETTFKLNEFSKVIQYTELYRRTFPAGTALPRMVWLLAQAHVQFMDCAKAIPLLENYLNSWSDHTDAPAVRQQLEYLKSMRHSRQVCAP